MTAADWSLHDHIEAICNRCEKVVVAMFLPKAWNYDVEPRCPFCGKKGLKTARVDAQEAVAYADGARPSPLTVTGEPPKAPAQVIQFPKPKEE